MRVNRDMKLIDDNTPTPTLSFSPTLLVDSPSYTLEDEIEPNHTLNFDNPGNVPTCLIHSIPMNYDWSLDPQTSNWKCPICEPKK